MKRIRHTHPYDGKHPAWRKRLASLIETRASELPLGE